MKHIRYDSTTHDTDNQGFHIICLWLDKEIVDMIYIDDYLPHILMIKGHANETEYHKLKIGGLPQD